MKLSGTIGIILRQVGGKAYYKSAVILVLGLGVLMSFFDQNAYAEDLNIKDSGITLAIATDLAVDELVSPKDAYLHTSHGIVTLTGSSDNLLSNERAVKIAESIKGVHAVVNKIDVKPNSLPDSEISRNVARALRCDPATGDYGVTVKVKNGIVYMSGQVASWSERQLAADVAKTVNGVRGIKNQISIDRHIKRTDSQIKSAVKRRFDLDFYVDNAWIDVLVKDGKVTLSGIVGSATEKSMACNDALVAGATSVKSNDLEVRWWLRDDLRRASKRPLKSDERIKEAIEDVFKERLDFQLYC